jgi:hypothetical protein
MPTLCKRSEGTEFALLMSLSFRGFAEARGAPFNDPKGGKKAQSFD